MFKRLWKKILKLFTNRRSVANLPMHEHHYVKHYDKRVKGYVNRCTICDKVVERHRPTESEA